MILAETKQTLIAEYGDVLPPTFIASTVELAASSPSPDAPPGVETARADVSAAAQAALRARAAANVAPAGV